MCHTLSSSRARACMQYTHAYAHVRTTACLQREQVEQYQLKSLHLAGHTPACLLLEDLFVRIVPPLLSCMGTLHHSRSITMPSGAALGRLAAVGRRFHDRNDRKIVEGLAAEPAFVRLMSQQHGRRCPNAMQHGMGQRGDGLYITTCPEGNEQHCRLQARVDAS